MNLVQKGLLYTALTLSLIGVGYVGGCAARSPERVELKGKEGSNDYLVVISHFSMAVPMVSTNGVKGPYIPLGQVFREEMQTDEQFVAKRREQRANLAIKVLE